MPGVEQCRRTFLSVCDLREFSTALIHAAPTWCRHSGLQTDVVDDLSPQQQGATLAASLLVEAKKVL